MRKIQFQEGQYYHIYNRGVEKRNTFLDEKDFRKFLNNLRDFNNDSFYEQRLQALKSSRSLAPFRKGAKLHWNFKNLQSFLEQKEKIVHLISYSLNPNHFHLLIKQLKPQGISRFMHKLSTSFTNYFNKRYQRTGALFQGPFKAIHIDNNRYLLWLAGYINGNTEIHHLAKAEEYPWSSFQSIFQTVDNNLLDDFSLITSQFKDIHEFRQFIKEIIQESRSKKEMAKYLLEEI